MGIGLGLGAVIGAALGAAGGTLQDLPPALWLLDLAGIAVLIGMVCRPPQPAQVAPPAASQLPPRVPTQTGAGPLR